MKKLCKSCPLLSRVICSISSNIKDYFILKGNMSDEKLLGVLGCFMVEIIVVIMICKLALGVGPIADDLKVNVVDDAVSNERKTLLLCGICCWFLIVYRSLEEVQDDEKNILLSFFDVVFDW